MNIYKMYLKEQICTDKKFDYLSESNNEICNLFIKINELEEILTMYNEENKYYIKLINDVTEKTIYDFIFDLAEQTKKNILMYQCFKGLENNLPYFQKFISTIKVEKISDTLYLFPYINNNKIMEIANLEISRAKFSL